VKIAVQLICFWGTAIWIALLFFASRFGNWGDGSGSYPPNHLMYIWYACPFVYFAIIFCTTFARYKSVGVLSAGIVSHSILATFVVSFFTDGTMGVMFAVPSFFCALMWVLMFLTFDKKPAPHVH